MGYMKLILLLKRQIRIVAVGIRRIAGGID
jgi:hypothetical protein